MKLPEIGDTFEGKYRIDRLIGRGGFGHVYAGLHVAMEREVAIKVLVPGPRGYDPMHAARFLREAKVLGSLRSPHVVSLYDFGRAQNGLLFMVFELLDGRDLSDVAKDEDLSEPIVVHILRQILDAMQEAHSAGLLHRDIKPDNIRVFARRGDDYRVKLLDFGIAKSFSEAQASLTQQGKVVGTPRYMSPEQIKGDELGPATDIYSLGLVAYDLLVGREAAARRTVATRPRLSETDRVSPGLRDTVNRMLERDPQDRFHAAADVLEALRTGHDTVRDPVPEAATTPRASSPLPAAPTADAPTPQTRPHEQETAAGWPLVLAAAGVLAVIVVLGLRITARLDEPSPIPTAPRAETETQTETAEPVAAVDSPLEPDIGPSTADAAPSPPPRSGCGTPPAFERRGDLELLHGLRLVGITVVLPEGYDAAERHPLLLVYPDATVPKANKSPGAAPGTSGEPPPNPAPTDPNQPLDARPPGQVGKHTLTALADWHGWVLAAIADPTQSDVDDKTIAAVVREVEATLCIDPARRYGFGIGTGAFRMVKHSCHLPLAAIATTSFRALMPECVDGEIPPHLDLADLADPSLERGGVFCIGRKVQTLADTTTSLAESHGCKQGVRSWGGRDGCSSYDCTVAPLVQCRVPWGRAWPPVVDGAPREACFGPEPRFAHAAVAYEFLYQYVLDGAEPL